MGGGERVLSAGVSWRISVSCRGVAKAYLGSADSFEKLGKKDEAVKTYQEMLRNPKLADFGEAAQARQRLQALGGA